MYNDVVKDGKSESTIKQRSAYYGTYGIVWSLKDEKMEDGLTHYYTLSHYDTDIADFCVHRGCIESIRILGGYSITDSVAINSMLYCFGINRRILAHIKKGDIYLEKKDSSGVYRVGKNGGRLVVFCADLRYYNNNEW